MNRISEWTGCARRIARKALRPLIAASLALFACAAKSEEGVTPDTITLTRVIALKGPSGAKGREQEAALQAYLAAVNAEGGVHGRKIRLLTTDEDLRTDEAMKRIAQEQRPFALFLMGGAIGSAVAVKYATPLKIPFVAPNTGAVVFQQSTNRYVFNVRATYRDEVLAAVRHFVLVKQQRMALLYVDDAYGRDGLESYRESIRLTEGAQSVYEGSFTVDNSDAGKHARALAEAAPHVVVCFGSAKRVAELVKAAREARVPSVFMTVSNNSSAGFARELGDHARGVIVSQVTPPAGVQTTRLSRELHRLLSGKPDAELSYAAMEAYVSAKVLVEGLRRAGPQLTREGFVQALETLRRFDLGGMEVDYSPTKHSGSNYVELSILTEDGRYRR